MYYVKVKRPNNKYCGWQRQQSHWCDGGTIIRNAQTRSIIIIKWCLGAKCKKKRWLNGKTLSGYSNRQNGLNSLNDKTHSRTWTHDTLADAPSKNTLVGLMEQNMEMMCTGHTLLCGYIVIWVALSWYASCCRVCMLCVL